MFDTLIVIEILTQVLNALERIENRSKNIKSANDFTDTPSGMEKLDGICMLFISVGEAMKNIDKKTGGKLFIQYPDIDWKGVMGFRDIIAHHYFDIDAEQIFWICRNELETLTASVRRMIASLS